MPLAVFRFPQLIQSEIVDNLMPEEIFLLSLCSQNSFKVLQSNFRKSAKLKITVDVSTSLCARYDLNGRRGQFLKFVEHFTECCGTSLKHVKIGCEKVHICRDEFEEYCRFNLLDSKLVIDHIARLFRKNVHHVELHGRLLWKNVVHPSELYRKPQGEPQTTLRRASKEQEKETEDHSYGGSSFNGDDDWFSYTQAIDYSPRSSPTFSSRAHKRGLEHFGSSSNRTDHISNDSFDKNMDSTIHADELEDVLFDQPSILQFSNELQIDLDLSKMISWDTVDHLDTNVAIPTDALKGVCKTIWIKDASFVTLDDLMNMDQVEIYLEESKMTSADINSYLKSWMRNRGSSQLKFIKCGLTGGVDKLYEGLYVARAEMKEYKSLRDGDALRLPTRTRLRFLPDFELQRLDGATVAGVCDVGNITLLFNPPKPGFQPRHPSRKGTRPTKYSIPFNQHS